MSIPDWTYFAIHKDTQYRQLFKTRSSFEMFVNDCNFRSEQWVYACWRKKYTDIKPRLLKSFLGTPGCGLHGGRFMHELKKLDRGAPVYIAIKGHMIPVHQSSVELSDVHFNCFKFDNRRYEDIIVFMRKYLVSKSLPADSQLIVAANSGYEYHPDDLPNFCFPDTNPDISFFNSYSDLIIGLHRE